MSSLDDYAPRSSRRERPRYDDGPGLTYPDEESAATKPRKARNDASPQRRRDPDPRDVEPKYYAPERDIEPSRKPNTTARRRSPYSDDDLDRSRGAAAYGRSKGYREPVPAPEVYRDRDLGKSRDPRRTRTYDDYSPEPSIQRSKSTREPGRRRDEDPYYQPESRSRRDDDRYGDRDRGYRSDGRDGYSRRRDDDRDRRMRSDDYYGSSRGDRRDTRDRDRDRDRYRYDDRDRDRRRYDSDRERGGRDRDHDRDRGGSKKKGFNITDVNKLYEQGQKHYKTVAPLIEKVAKMYMDSKGGTGGR